METSRVQLTSKDILEKEFKTAIKGYNQIEVDEFLDLIIKDYEFFTREIERLKTEIERLKRENSQSRTHSVQPNHQVNYDILRRLSNLEKEVFGRKAIDS